DQRCRFPGCSRAAVFCDVDHTYDRQFGGATELDNLAMLCPHHHRVKHDTTWKVEQIGGGKLRWTSPNGRQHVTLPENEVRPFHPRNAETAVSATSDTSMEELASVAEVSGISEARAKRAPQAQLAPDAPDEPDEPDPSGSPEEAGERESAPPPAAGDGADPAPF
ncbi:MAG: HNH endonuclease signature motif containing protein, partial [Mycetocola sp.]